MKEKKYSIGTALAEYVLPIMLLIGLSSMVSILGAFPDIIKQYLQTSNNGAVNGATLKIGSLGEVSPATMAAYVNSQNYSAYPQGKVCLPGNHICIKFPLVSNNPMSDTTGGLGGTNSVYSLDRLALELQQAGADPTLVNLIGRLALAGHGIGSNIGNLVSVCTNDPNNCVAPSASTFQGIKQQLDNYLSAHPDQYKAISTTINAASNQILAVANGVQITSTYRTVTQAPSDTQLSSLQSAADLIHQDSNTICNKGGNHCVQGG